jgi:hypothetical protein
LAQRFYIASDAMNIRGAGIAWTARGDPPCLIYRQPFRGVESNLHINAKETLTALRTIAVAVQTFDLRNCELIVAVDNTTARFVVEHKYFPTEPGINAQIAALVEELEGRGICLTAVQIPGKQMAADEPSRMEAIDEEKSRQCLKLIRELHEHHRRMQRVFLDDHE